MFPAPLQAQRNFIFSAFLLFFLLPAVLITLVYCHIVYRLCIAQCQNTLMLESAKQKMRSRKGVLKILGGAKNKYICDTTGTKDTTSTMS